VIAAVVLETEDVGTTLEMDVETTIARVGITAGVTLRKATTMEAKDGEGTITIGDCRCVKDMGKLERVNFVFHSRACGY
jgi:hypothetical protein